MEDFASWWMVPLVRPRLWYLNPGEEILVLRSLCYFTHFLYSCITFFLEIIGSCSNVMVNRLSQLFKPVQRENFAPWWKVPEVRPRLWYLNPGEEVPLMVFFNFLFLIFFFFKLKISPLIFELCILK